MAQALYDEHPIQDYLRVEVGEEQEQLIPGTHPTFDRVLFIEELPPVDLRWLAPVFERISETVREESRKRRKGEAFAEVFKYKLVSSALLAVSTAEYVAPSPTAFASTSTSSKVLLSNDTSEVVMEGSLVVPRMSGPPGNLEVFDDEDDEFYDAQDTLLPPIKELPELPSIPIVSTALLVLLRFPHILLLLVVLCIPFWSAYLVEGRLWAFLLQSGQDERYESDEADVGYEETLSTLNTLISCYDLWEQTTHHAITHLSSSQFVSYAYTPDPAQSNFPPMFTHSSEIGTLSEVLARTLQSTGSHTSTIRSLLSALARSPREMRMLERMYAPVSPSIPSFATALRRSGSSRSATTANSQDDEEFKNTKNEDEDDLRGRFTPSTPKRGKRPLSLSPSSPSISLTSPYQSPPSSVIQSSRLLLSPPPPSRTLSPPLTPSARPQSLSVIPSDAALNSFSRQRLPYSISSMTDMRAQTRSQSPSLSPQMGSRSSGAQRSAPASPLTKFTSLPSRVGSLSNSATRGRRKSLSSLRPWSASASESVLYTPPSSSFSPSRPASSPSAATITFESSPSKHYSHTSLSTSYSQSHLHTRTSTQDLEPIIIPTSELLELKRDAKGEIRHTAGCLLGLRFLSTESTKPAHLEKKKIGFSQLWSIVQSYFWPSSAQGEGFLTPPEPKRRPSDISIIREDEDEDEDEEDDALDAEIAYDPAYWEDVRSVLGLFRTALEDGVEKLREAFPRSAFPSPLTPVHAPAPVDVTIDSDPSTSTILTPASAHTGTNPLLDLPDANQEVRRTNELLSFLKGGKAGVSGNESGFAPMPSQLSRFVRSMEAIKEALADAQVALRECVEVLASSNSTSGAPTDGQNQMDGYDRLRSALGVALRECERGRTPLMEHFHPSKSRFGFALDDTIPEEDSDHLRESMPPLVHDDQDDHERSSTESMAMSPPPHALTHSEAMATIVEGNPVPERDANAPTLQQLLEHALMSIPEGREQVYEGEPEAASTFDRKKSTLSREERIKLVKARRASGVPSIPIHKEEKKKKSSRPALEVVQELKDAIWQVGERRRRSGRTARGSRLRDN